MEQQSKPLSRRTILKNSLLSTGALLSAPAIKSALAARTAKKPLRLGGPVFEKYDSPDNWVKAVKQLGYNTAYCPVGVNEKDDVIKAYEKAAKDADIVIAEVGAWSNPISPNPREREKALKKCRDSLALAERIGANCCVNITGSKNPKNWAGHHPENLTDETFDMIVETTRSIIDEVKPARTFYTLETMPWAYPDSADSYLKLVRAIDRKHFAVHLDPANLICSPQRYYSNAKIISECFEKLGPMVKSCHAKDITLTQELTTHLNEVRPGLGGLDYKTFLTELSKLNDIPLMLEHLNTPEEYNLAAKHIRSVAASLDL